MLSQRRRDLPVQGHNQPIRPKTGERIDVEKVVPKPKPPVNKNRAFTFRKFLTGEDVMKISSSEVNIDSDDLKLLLGEVTDKYWKDEKVRRLSSPYAIIIHCWDEAGRIANNEEEGDTEEKRRVRTNLKELLYLISTSSGNENVDQFLKERDNPQTIHCGRFSPGEQSSSAGCSRDWNSSFGFTSTQGPSLPRMTFSPQPATATTGTVSSSTAYHTK